ncbi:hypothetical protein JNB11_03660 [Kocuria palustris]|nr:hypothetical protein [Kocuria palustris]
MAIAPSLPVSDIAGRRRRRRALGAPVAAANGDDTGAPLRRVVPPQGCHPEPKNQAGCSERWQ